MRPRPDSRLVGRHFCPTCERWLDFWPYKAHQDACMAQARKERAA